MAISIKNEAQYVQDPQSIQLSIIIPAKDEATSIGKLITQIKENLNGVSYEMIVVDDGSVDNTGEAARVNGARPIFHVKNRGKGAAMKTGVENARGEIIVFLDGDGAHEPRDIPQVIAPILEEKAAFVNGSRALLGSKVDISPFARRLSNKLASFTISMIISFVIPIATFFKCPIKYIKVTDCTSGFRAIEKRAWQKLDLISEGFEIETEMIYEAVRKGIVLTEVPISCNWDSSFSRLSIFGDGLKTIKILLLKLIGDIRGR